MELFPNLSQDSPPLEQRIGDVIETFYKGQKSI